MVTVMMAVAPVLGGLVSVAVAWLQRQAQERRLSRRDLRGLPPGSRVIDLGEYGLVIEIGAQLSHASTTGNE